MEPAGTRLSNTFELLEMILVKVPSKTVLLAQRVSKKWHSTINGSKQLQRILFTEPVDRIKTAFLRDDPIFRTWKKIPHNDADGRRSDVIPNPMIAQFFKAMERITLAVLKHDFPMRNLSAELPKAWLSPTASWRRMVVSQPPVEAEFRVSSGNDDIGWNMSNVETELIRLGDIVDWVNTEHSIKARECEHKWVLLEHSWHWSEVDKLEELEIARLL